RRFDHLVDWRDPGDWFLGELSERIRNGADQTPIDIDRAAAHTGDHARIRERSAFELGGNQIATRTDDVAQHAEDVNLEVLQLIALKHGAAGANHAGLELIDGERGRRSREANANKDQ